MHKMTLIHTQIAALKLVIKSMRKELHKHWKKIDPDIALYPNSTTGWSVNFFAPVDKSICSLANKIQRLLDTGELR